MNLSSRSADRKSATQANTSADVLRPYALNLLSKYRKAKKGKGKAIADPRPESAAEAQYGLAASNAAEDYIEDMTALAIRFSFMT